jgi:Ni/Co efflux regulator RcnB
MKKLFLIALAVLFAPAFVALSPASASTMTGQANQNTEARPSSEVRNRGRHKRRKHRRHGIGQSYKEGGTSAARGGKRFGKNIARGKPIKAGQELGQGAGRAGKNVGQGSKQVGEKVVDKTKKVVKPPQ